MIILKRLAIEMAAKKGMKMLPEFNQVTELAAAQMAMYYKSLMDAGFTAEQAMDIIKDHGVDVGKMSWLLGQEE